MRATEWFYGQPHGFHDHSERLLADARTSREIERHAENMASEALDRGEEVACNWLDDQGVPKEVASILLLVYGLLARPNHTDIMAELERAMNALRDKYLHDCAPLYRGEAEAEIVEAAMDSAEDR